ncbi:hypothetical protein Trydic_g8914, partial [Trypoxylus dichotomus]
MKLNILYYVEEQSVGSVLDVAKHFGVLYISVYKTLKDYEYKPYKILRRQEFFDEDK